MAQSFQVSLPAANSDLEFAAEQEEIARRRRLADMLRQQSAQPEGQMISGRFVAPSITQRLAGLFNSYQSGQIDRQAAEQARRVAQARGERTANDIGAVVNAMTGGRNYTQTGMTGGLDSQDMTVEQGRPDLAQALRAAGAAQSPEARAFVPQILGMQQRQQETAEERAWRESERRAREAFEREERNRPRPVTVTERLPDGSTRQVIREVGPGQADGMVVGETPAAPAPTRTTNRGIEEFRNGQWVPTGLRPYQAPSQGGIPVQPITVSQNGRDVVIDARTGRVIGDAPPKDGGGGKPLAPTALTNLSELGTTAQNMSRIASTFKDGFGGYRAGVVGNAANLIGRNVGGGFQDQANWWQDYQMEKNIVRNRLFGSALTATEAAEWEKAAISPGMTPQAIRANLERQRLAALSAAAKLAGSYAAQGFNREAIEQAIGVPLDELQKGARDFANLGRVSSDPRLENPVPAGVLPTPGVIEQPGRSGQPAAQGGFRVLGVER